ncbi:uncharacterized protein LOC129598333 [Paramacrobiotus metropolitanus]|uniref:uncharacterized protein LOC129598333 n=1 Tax=Paramacrobiotus metropolitanus TaxID=2943436 RepID=UPI002445DBF3|nr:uncharacterized protein LOC129598333 [Paramacrobiotus metropolitanus]
MERMDVIQASLLNVTALRKAHSGHSAPVSRPLNSGIHRHSTASTCLIRLPFAARILCRPRRITPLQPRHSVSVFFSKHSAPAPTAKQRPVCVVCVVLHTQHTTPANRDGHLHSVVQPTRTAPPPPTGPARASKQPGIAAIIVTICPSASAKQSPNELDLFANWPKWRWLLCRAVK